MSVDCHKMKSQWMPQGRMFTDCTLYFFVLMHHPNSSGSLKSRCHELMAKAGVGESRALLGHHG